MFYIRDVIGDNQTMVPVCMDCICASCSQPCGECTGNTEDGSCCRSICVIDEDGTDDYLF